jgi:gluconate 5-dehydrogenase
MKKIFDMLRLDGKVAIITGGQAGLGYDIACAFAEAGASLIITSRNAESAKAATERLAGEYGAEVMTCRMDQQHYAQVEAMAAAVMERFGRIDILVNNAGGGSGKSEGNLFARDPGQIKAMIDTNLTGMIFCCKAVGKYMMRQKSGKIINLGSVAGMCGRNRNMYRKTNKMEQPVDYSAAKGGVISVTRDLAGLMSPNGICVNCISPGGFDRGDLPQSFIDAYSEETPLGRMGKIGSDIKGPALLLASSAGDYITGHNLVVDGGFSIWK